MAAEMQLTFLGTSSAQPSTTRNLSGLALRLDGEVWLFDCGEGTQYQFQKTSSIKLSKVTCIFITHLHGDHVFGLPGLLCSLGGVIGGGGGAAEDGTAVAELDVESLPVIDIVGPEGLREFIRTSLSRSYSMLSYRLRMHELHWAEPEK